MRRTDLQLSFARQILERVELALSEMPVDPGKGHVAPQAYFREREQRAFLANLGVGTIPSKLEFVAAREFLHETDLAHGHEIAREIEAISAIHRQVIQTDDQFRIGKLTGADSGGFRSTNRSGLRLQLWCIGTGDALRPGERERGCGVAGRYRRQ